MKRLLFCLMLLSLIPLFAQMTIPRVYVQKLTLDDGSLPKLTNIDKVSAEEYLARAWMEANPEEVISTETHPPNTITVKEVGKEGVMEQTAVINIQLGNFRRQWEVGDVMHIVLSHKASGESKGWSVEIPEGTALIRKLDDAIIIPPTTKKKK